MNETERAKVFNLQFPAQNAEVSQLRLEAGEMLFVLGANGTGKSSLMFHIAKKNRGATRKISAHRQTWMNSDALDMTPSTKMQTEQQIQNEDRQQTSRYRDSYAAQRASMTIYELIDAENIRARRIAGLARISHQGDTGLKFQAPTGSNTARTV